MTRSQTANKTGGIQAEPVWNKIQSVVTRAVRSALSACPIEHQDEVVNEIESAFRLAELRSDIQNPKAFALRITQRKIVDHLRRRSHILQFRNLAGGDDFDVADVSSETAETIVLRTALEEELAELARRDPEILQAFLQRLSGTNVEDIAAELGVSAATVYRRIEAARDYLRKTLL
jgi:RNA polymerase sigma factor (sigma-70 family)